MFYVRNHLPVPEVDSEEYELEVEVEGKEGVKVFNLEDIKKLPKHTVTATIMCAGNRRSEMNMVTNRKFLIKFMYYKFPNKLENVLFK